MRTNLKLGVMEALSMACSRTRAFSAAAGARSLTSLQSIHSRNSLGFEGGLQPLRMFVDGGSRGATGERGIRKSSSFAVRGSVVSAAESPATVTSFEELKKKGESYFLTDSRPVILFDGVCNMCNGGVNFVLDNDAEGKLRYAALQSEAGRALLVKSGRKPDDITSVVLVDKDRAYIKSEAVLRTAQYLRFPFPPAAFLSFVVPLFLRDLVYDTVADNRYSVFGQTNVCRVSDARFGERFLE